MLPAIRPVQRPGRLILGLLGAVLVVVVVWAVWPAASQPPSPSNQSREQRKTVAKAPGQGPAMTGQSAPLPGQLDVRLEALKQPPPAPAETARNPFTFYVKPPPPPPPPPKFVAGPPPAPVNTGPPPPPPLPPIPLKFIGTMEQGNRKVAIFSDGRGLPLYGKEGELVLGQYRIVRIGVESVVMEYADGRGRQTIPMRGQ
jgi:hypothetical protein